MCGNSPGSPSATLTRYESVQRSLGLANMRLREKLAQVLPTVFAPPLVRLSSFNAAWQRATRFDDLYRSAARRADRTTAILCGLAAAIVLTAAKLLQLW